MIGPKLNLLPVGTVGYSLSGLYLLTNPARLNLPGTKVPAGIVLKVTEPQKLHHRVKVITRGSGYAGVIQLIDEVMEVWVIPLGYVLEMHF